MPLDMFEPDAITLLSMMQQRQQVNHEILVLDRLVGNGAEASDKPFREVVDA
jgi:hypothetical protein